MNGRTHSLSGAVGWLAIAPHVTDLPAEAIMAGTVTAMGSSLLPDLDGNGSVTYYLGPISRAASAPIRAVTSHRGMLHSIAATVAMILLTATLQAVHPIASGTIVGICAAIGIRALGPPKLNGTAPWLSATLVGMALGGLAVLAVDEWWWLPWAVGGGYAAHIAGDVLSGGTQLLWPMNGRHGVQLFKTDGITDHVVSAGLSLAFVALAISRSGLLTDMV